MLYTHETRFFTILGEQPNQIVKALAYRCYGPFSVYSQTQPKKYFQVSTFKTNDSPADKQNLQARITCALMQSKLQTVFRTRENRLDHLTGPIFKSIARHIARRFTGARACPHNPETHIAYKIGKHKKRLTFGRFIRRECDRIFTGDFAVSDAQLDQMSAGFRINPQLPEVSFLTGQDACDIYENRIGHTYTECMIGTGYVDHQFQANCDKLRLVIGRSHGKLQFRAKLFLMDDGRSYLDRVYPSDWLISDFGNENAVRQAIELYLTKSGLVLAPEDDYKITLRHDEGEPMPYMDYPCQFDRLDDRRVKFHPRGDCNAQCTDGEDESVSNSHRCSCCDCRLSDDDSLYSEITNQEYCDDCYSQEFCYDEYSECDIFTEDAVYTNNGLTTHRDNCTELDTEFYSRRSRALTEDTCDDYDGRTILQEHARPLYNGDVCHEDDRNCIELADGQYAPTEDTCEIDGEYFLTDDCIEFDFGWVHSDDCEWKPDNYGNLVLVPMAD